MGQIKMVIICEYKILNQSNLNINEDLKYVIRSRFWVNKMTVDERMNEVFTTYHLNG